MRANLVRMHAGVGRRRCHFAIRVVLVCATAFSLLPGPQAAHANPEMPPAPGHPFTGTMNYVSLLCRFGDDPSTPHPANYYRELMGGGARGQNNYWREVSFGQLDLQGQDVFGWYDLPNPRSYYFHEDGRTDGGKIRDDCTAAADADVNFPAYDGIIFWLNGDLSHLGHGGRLVLSRDGVEKDYARVLMADQEEPWGVLAHEIGHGFDWRAHSSTGPCCDGDSTWDLMGSISFGCNASWLECVPVHPLAYRKLTAGWIRPDQEFVAGPNQTSTIQLTPASNATSSGLVIARVPIRGSSTRFYTVEVRRQVGYDAGLLREGVLIHYVDEVKDHVWIQRQPEDTSDAGSGNWLTGDTFVDSTNGISISVGNGDPTSGYEIAIDTPAWSVSSNDEPAAALSIEDPATFTDRVYTDLATVSASEPTLTCTGDRPTNTVWYKVVPSADGWFSFTTKGSDYPAVIAIFRSSSGAMDELRCGYDYGWSDSPSGADGIHDLPMQSGQTYLVEVGSFGWENGGDLRVGTKFSVSPEAFPPLDDGEPVVDPVEEPVVHERSIRFRLRNHLLAKGTLVVGDGFRDCLSSVPVQIQRKTSGEWRRVWGLVTTDVGSFRKPLLDKSGRYRAVVSESVVAGHHCPRAVSPIRRHTHG